MHRILSLLTCSLVACAALSGADGPRIATLAELDKAPERLEAPPAVITDELRRAGTNDTVTMTAVVGTDGKVMRVEDVKAATPATAKAATQAVKGWTFNRASVAGQAAAFRLPVAIAIRPGEAREDAADDGESVGTSGGVVLKVATPVYETIPEYPATLRENPVDGYAMVNLRVEPDGRPADAVVEFASRDEFAATAAAVVQEWSFEPLIHAGEPVGSRTTVSVQFPARSAAWDADMRTRQAQLAYVRSYDEAPREKSSRPVVFPYDALLGGKRGIATLGVVVSPEGRVVQVSPGPDAEPDFVAAARASLALWEFFPAVKAGRPVYGLIAMNLNFDPHREEFGFDTTTFALMSSLNDGTAPLVSLKDVDARPAPLTQVAPVLPLDHTGPLEGDALIEVIIDKEGRPQLPRIIRATDPGLGWAAATAVSQWRFSPARKGDEPVMCRARLPLKFGPQAPAP